MHLTINEGALLTMSAGMQKLCDQEEDRLNQIEYLIYNLSTEWQGESEKEYMNTFALVQAEYRNVIKELRNYGTMLQSIVKDCVAIEEKYAAKFKTV